MKIGKIIKITGIAIFIGSFLFILYTFIKDLNYITASKDYMIILNYLFTLIQAGLISLLTYGFGEIIVVLKEINAKCKND